MIGILSDAHGNIAAFRKGLECLDSLGAKQFVFLGDALGYYPSSEVVNDLMSMGGQVRCIMGNHEEMILNGVSDPKSEPVYQHDRIRKQLNCKQKEFLSSWRTNISEVHNNFRVLYVHGGPSDFTNQYLYPDTDLSHYYLKEKYVFSGHSHHPFVREVNSTVYVNVGSCGMPRDDGRYGSVCLFDPEHCNVALYRYNIEKTYRASSNEATYFVHASVSKLLKRRSEKLIGKIVEWS